MSDASSDGGVGLHLALIAAIAVLALPVSGVAAQETETSANATCSADGPAQLRSVRLAAEDRTIGDESGGRLGVSLQSDPTESCPVVVNVTLAPAGGVRVAAARDGESLDDGTVRTQFVLEPGENASDPEVKVVENGTGRTYVEGNVTYWPEGHPDLSRSMAGMRVQFEAATPSPSTTVQTTSADGPMVGPIAAAATLLACLAGLRVWGRRGW